MGKLFLTINSFLLFQSIEPGETFTSDASMQEYNKTKNRYPNILACKYNEIREFITLMFPPKCQRFLYIRNKQINVSYLTFIFPQSIILEYAWQPVTVSWAQITSTLTSVT